MRIDLNCDMGESFGRYSLGNDQALMPYVSSANIACGLHAGDPLVLDRTVRLAKEYGVKETRFKVTNPEEQCLLCGLCVRVCEEVVGVQAISFGSRGVTKHIATPYMVPNEACLACGSCVTVCPTGAMQARLDKVRGDISARTGHGFAH